MERDEVFVPKTRSEIGLHATERQVEEKDRVSEFTETGILDRPTSLLDRAEAVFEDAPLWNCFCLLVRELLGFPLYLISHQSGHDYGRWTSHFDPKAPFFRKRHYWQVVASDIGVVSALAALTLWSSQRGFSEVFKYYILPYLVVNHHLVMITYLQHTSPVIPHYRGTHWTFARGALCTVDRNMFGAVGAYVFHGICETHVVHHLHSRLTHYHAWEATEAIKSVLGKHYHKCDENMYVQLYKTFVSCRFVEDTGPCVFYKNRSGQAAREAVLEADSGVCVRDSQSSDGDY